MGSNTPRIKPRRPIAWNALLAKGHVHQRSRTGERSLGKRALDDEVAQYLLDEAVDDAAGVGSPPEGERGTHDNRRPTDADFVSGVQTATAA